MDTKRLDAPGVAARPEATSKPRSAGEGIEAVFDVPFVADLALHEKQIQQNYRPVIAVHKWFARRPGTLFRALILSEFLPGPLRQSYYRPHNLDGIHIADPFMGGGTPLLEANRLGCRVTGYDINPMAYWVVHQEMGSLDIGSYRDAASSVARRVDAQIGRFYETTCLECGQPAPVKYFIWVKTTRCKTCGSTFDLFPGYLLAEDDRHPTNVLICPDCGDLNEVKDRRAPGLCGSCGSALTLAGPASRNRCRCPHCGEVNSYPDPTQGAPKHRMVAIEYHCSRCRPHHAGRFFKRPDQEDLARIAAVDEMWATITPAFVPDDEIPAGDETDRLHRWGYRYYREMFNPRQLLGLELLCRAVVAETDASLRDALATNLSDLLRYQNMLCRYDTRALKSLDIFSVHGFPVGLVQCESNLFGITNRSTGANVGSGGWSNIVEKYVRAKQYCEAPFEIRHDGARKVQVPVRGEWIGGSRAEDRDHSCRQVALTCGNAAEAELAPSSVDAVLTDPPYFANVQYAELMDFCFVWLRRLVVNGHGYFERNSTRRPEELTGNVTLERGLTHFCEGLSQTFIRMSRALKPGRPFVFTYHHNAIEAYYPLAVAVLDSGLTCSATIPCPAEMGASIHINGTGSSVVDTVFVCRSTGSVARRTIVSSSEGVAELVRRDLYDLSRGGIRPTQGDMRCLAFGHLIRLAIWNLRSRWDPTAPTETKLEQVVAALTELGGMKSIEERLSLPSPDVRVPALLAFREPDTVYESGFDEIPF